MGSQHIRRLEQQLGLRLFERQSRGVFPTPAGELLARAASESLSKPQQLAFVASADVRIERATFGHGE